MSLLCGNANACPFCGPGTSGDVAIDAINEIGEDRLLGTMEDHFDVLADMAEGSTSEALAKAYAEAKAAITIARAAVAAALAKVDALAKEGA